MSILEIILIAIGLSMDSLAVSIAAGIIMDKFHIRNIFRIAFFMAMFQGLMPLFGWLAGINFKSEIEAYDHWIAFGLLTFLGIKMIREGISSGKEEEEENSFDPTKVATILSLSVATSIDALAVGVSFAFLQIKVILPVIIISITTFIFSFAGASFGTKFGNKYNLPMEIIGGIILIGIGLKILLEHTGFLG